LSKKLILKIKIIILKIENWTKEERKVKIMSWNNNVNLIGRLTRDLEVGQTPKGKLYGRTCVAVDDSYKGADGQWVNRANFINIEIWGDALVSALKDKYKKGVEVAVTGELKINNYQAKDGTKRTATSVKVTSQRVLTRKNDGTPNGQFNAAQDFANQAFDTQGFTSVDDDETIPF
jgi:single-strand DNA-binding protein